MKHLRANFVLFPFLFGLYPVLALIAHNASEMDFSTGYRAIFFSLLFTLVLFSVSYAVIRDPVKSGLLVSVLILLFYSYGHINLLARDWSLGGFFLGRHRVLIPLYMILLGVACWLILRTKRDLSGSTRILNAFALILLFMPLFQIAGSLVEQYRARQQIEAEYAHQSRVSISPNQIPPDVYYIVLDGYPRGDFVEQNLSSSNQTFLDQLVERDFYVANCSQSNYSDTRFSLASTLNMTYLDGSTNKPEVVHPGAVLDQMIRSSEVQQNFSDLGYTIITFESGYKWLRWEQSDQHLNLADEKNKQLSGLGLNDFERLLVDTTAGKLLLDLSTISRGNQLAEILDNPRAAHRERVMYSLEKLPQIPAEFPSPKFIYAHIIFPHPPFVVDQAGNPLQNAPANELAAYADQITYLDGRLLKIIDAILQESVPPPVIILQGDHGATIDYQEHGFDPALRLGIFNAYYLPANSTQSSLPVTPREELYPEISPINSFRLVFDNYFSGEYGLLEDLSILGRQSPYIRLDCAQVD